MSLVNCPLCLYFAPKVLRPTSSCALCNSVQQSQEMKETRFLHWPSYLLIILLCLSSWCNALHVPSPWCHKPIAPFIQLKSSMTELSERDTLSINLSLASVRLDPLVTSFLMRTVHDVKDVDTASYFRLHDAHQAMLGEIDQFINHTF